MIQDTLTNRLAIGNIIIVLTTLNIVWKMEIWTLSIVALAIVLLTVNTPNPINANIKTPKQLNSKFIIAALFEFFEAPILERSAV